MAFLKFSRDKRGYEHFQLMQPSRGKGRPRVLYWFRTPPNIKVGRSPFDPQIRRAIEAEYPDVAFDWDTIVQTPIPPPVEPERWRERRRLERALRAADHEDDGGENVLSAEPPPEPIDEPAVTSNPPSAEISEEPEAADPLLASNLSAPPVDPGQSGGIPQGRRRRRRRGRRRSKNQPVAAMPGAPASAPEETTLAEPVQNPGESDGDDDVDD